MEKKYNVELAGYSGKQDYADNGTIRLSGWDKQRVFALLDIIMDCEGCEMTVTTPKPIPDEY